MATVEDLDYLNPSMRDDPIRRHLDRLDNAAVIAEHELEPGERHRDFPFQFYTVTDPARALFDNNDLFPVNAWHRQYQTVEKTALVREVETMPRPDTDTE